MSTTTHHSGLLNELEAAHRIIRNALAVMTAEQKAEWGRLNERDGVAGEGISRANEREAVIAQAKRTLQVPHHEPTEPDAQHQIVQLERLLFELQAQLHAVIELTDGLDRDRFNQDLQPAIFTALHRLVQVCRYQVDVGLRIVNDEHRILTSDAEDLLLPAGVRDID